MVDFYLGQSNSGAVNINLGMCNRHGLIAGASGTGKTTTMKALAGNFSAAGVPVFFSDVKGDLDGVSVNYPVRFWDIFGKKGHPIRVTISSMGPTLLARLLKLTDVQQGVLNIAFKVADEHGLLLLDLKDLRAMLSYVGENAAEFTNLYGNVSASSIGVIQRALLAFEQEGGECLFGEPELDIRDWMRTDVDGRGYVNILESSRLIQCPTVYATFLLWLLTELFEQLPEVGDLEKPRMVFFFDEAHLLFDDAPKALVQKIEQVVKLIRSKGVGVFFVTQAPTDIPDSVLAQLSNKIQHALRAYTPAEQKKIRAAAQSFRANSDFNTEEVLTQLGVGEALVSVLDPKGIPTVVQRTKISCPENLLDVSTTEAEIQRKINSSEFEFKYRESVDRESAYEILEKAKAEMLRMQEEEKAAAAAEKERLAAEKQAEKERIAAEKAKAAEEKAAAKAATAKTSTTKKSSTKQSAVQKAATTAANSVARSVSTNVVNSVLGGKTNSAQTIAKRAASTALNSVMRSGTTSI
ncbi:MAG: DUF853 domain-containing protein, partial [Clostridia bacterium]|nr:DUF853 domain-containing protein [Clostridia bacterium]